MSGNTYIKIIDKTNCKVQHWTRKMESMTQILYFGKQTTKGL